MSSSRSFGVISHHPGNAPRRRQASVVQGRRARMDSDPAPIAMGESLSFRVRTAIEAIEPANLAAEAWLSARSATPEAAFLVRLAIEELVTNSIKYGYEAAAERAVDVSLSIADQVLTMVFVDDGRAFDPLTAAPPDLSLPLEERP